MLRNGLSNKSRDGSNGSSFETNEPPGSNESLIDSFEARGVQTVQGLILLNQAVLADFLMSI